VSGPKRRPHRSNSPLDIIRDIKTQKVIYWTVSRLQKLLPGVFNTAREDHFARALEALNKWPKLNPEQILENAARDDAKPRRLMNGGWAWPHHGIERQLREYADRAPSDSIDLDKLRETLDGMDDRTRLRFMEMVVEALPPQKGTPTGLDTRVLMKIRDAHKWMMKSLASHPGQKESGHWVREIDLNKGAKVPSLNPTSTASWWLSPTGWWWKAPTNRLPH
jgi:hypothetical protein